MKICFCSKKVNYLLRTKAYFYSENILCSQKASQLLKQYGFFVREYDYFYSALEATLSNIRLLSTPGCRGRSGYPQNSSIIIRFENMLSGQGRTTSQENRPRCLGIPGDPWAQYIDTSLDLSIQLTMWNRSFCGQEHQS